MYCSCLVAKSQLTSATPWTVACQAPLSFGFPRQEYWSRLPFPPPRALPNPGIKPIISCMVSRFFTTELPGKPIRNVHEALEMYQVLCWALGDNRKQKKSNSDFIVMNSASCTDVPGNLPLPLVLRGRGAHFSVTVNNLCVYMTDSPSLAESSPRGRLKSTQGTLGVWRTLNFHQCLSNESFIIHEALI